MAGGYQDARFSVVLCCVYLQREHRKVYSKAWQSCKPQFLLDAQLRSLC